MLHLFTEDDRMYHICMWPGHREHFHERNDVFYKRFSEILAFNRLVSFIHSLIYSMLISFNSV